MCDKGLFDYLISNGYHLKDVVEKNEYRGIKKDIYYFDEAEKVKEEMQYYFEKNRRSWVITDTKQLFEIIDSQMVDIIKIEFYNSLYMETETVSEDKFLCSLKTLSDSELFQDAVEWECNFKTKECDLYVEGHINEDSMVMVYIRFNGGISVKDIFDKLYVEKFKEE